MTAPRTEVELDELASRPDEKVICALGKVSGPVLVLGAGGKMGYHLCRMLKRARLARGSSDDVVAVSRFGGGKSLDLFKAANVFAIAADLLDEESLKTLPDPGALFFMAGLKFGTGDQPHLLQRFNIDMPRMVADRFRGVPSVVMSTGCVYPYVDVADRGSREDDPADPPGAYARSCLGRETAFVEAAEKWNTPSVLIRLNYSVDLRYGVLVDIAERVFSGKPVSLATGHANVIWQGDALRYIVAALGLVEAPPFVLNVTGPDRISVRDAALLFGEAFGCEVDFTGQESGSAWLSDSSLCRQLLGEPEIRTDALVKWVAGWIGNGGATLGKPTQFENRSGDF